jgi:hypothetical protein
VKQRQGNISSSNDDQAEISKKITARDMKIKQLAIYLP